MADDVINEELAAAPPAAVHAAIDDVIGEELAAAPPPLDAVHDAIDHVMDEELRRRRRGSRFVRGTPEAFTHSWLMHHAKAKKSKKGPSSYVKKRLDEYNAEVAVRERDKIVDITMKKPKKIKKKGWWRHWTAGAIERAAFGSTWIASPRRRRPRRRTGATGSWMSASTRVYLYVV